jgi:pyridoxine 5'-phosphate synthase PdxJ
MNVKIKNQLEKLKNAGIQVKYFIQGENKVIDL